MAGNQVSTDRNPLVQCAAVAAVALAAGIACAQDEGVSGGPSLVSPAPGTAAVPAGRLTSDDYLISDQGLLSGDTTIGWKGFVTGLEGFDHFHDPISNPLYHEPAMIDSGFRLLYLFHDFPETNVIGGGEAEIIALQARLALTERLAFIATKDGYTWMDSGLTGEKEGFNDIALGLKFAAYANTETDTLITIGGRYQWRTGAKQILQGSAEEVSPFVSFAQGFDKLRLHGNLTYRAGISEDEDDGNDILQWSIHAEYEIKSGVAPVVEINGLHYLEDGGRTGIDTGGLDYTNLGSTDVAGKPVIWVALGASFRLTPNLTFGATYEIPFTDPSEDLMERRVTAALNVEF